MLLVLQVMSLERPQEDMYLRHNRIAIAPACTNNRRTVECWRMKTDIMSPGLSL